ncbi:MAG: integrase core domain-containing protein [Candidatus Omnitrophica bacterium]|nr:integrase core domain-containing protein [Candidatus Omnitrophota bacterium]
MAERFKESKENVESLRDLSTRPINKRKWEITPLQEEKIITLRRRYMYYGKKKLKILYEKENREEISCWKIERVIRRHRLYADRIRAEKIAKKQASARENLKLRIQKLKKEKRIWFLFQLDTIVIYWGKIKRYILTAVDYASKPGYARMYKTKSSKVARDFLYRLRYLINHPIENIQTDNCSEFAHYFERTSQKVGIRRYFSRVRMPQDNPEAERCNETLEYEWLYNGNLDLDCERFNRNLTEWLIEYNFNRPHKSLLII